MQVIANLTSASPPPTPLQGAPQNTIIRSAPRETGSAPMVVLNKFEPPTKADTQSVVQALIEGGEILPDIEAKTAAAHEAEQQAKAAARTKSIMGMLPANPSDVTKLMSALAAATSAEAIADIKLNAQPVD